MPCGRLFNESDGSTVRDLVRGQVLDERDPRIHVRVLVGGPRVVSADVAPEPEQQRVIWTSVHRHFGCCVLQLQEERGLLVRSVGGVCNDRE